MPARDGVPAWRVGPYVSERQWGTVREDYGEDGDAWNHLPHDHARSRAYRWGEDGLAGFCDVHQRLCLYHYPQAAFPYDQLRLENSRRDRRSPEYEVME